MKRILLLLIFSVLTIFSSVGQIAAWNYSSTTTVFNATTLDPNATATEIKIIPTTVISYQASPSSIAGASWSTNATFVASGKFFEFSVSPKFNYKLSITGFSFEAGRTTAGPQKIEVQYSLDGFATSGVSLGTFDNANTSTLSPFIASSFTFSTESTVTFRLWGFAASSTGNFRLNNVVISGATATLPISLTSFTAKPIDKTILLNWKTASEKSNKYFEIQRSADGKSFTKITTLDAAGNSDTENSYTFTDQNPFAGTNYYKLIQYDIDGKSTSKIITVDSKLDKAQVFISTTNSSVDLNISSPNNTKASVYLYDLEGGKITERKINLTKGSNAFNFEKSLSPGIYFVSLVTEGSKINVKFAKW